MIDYTLKEIELPLSTEKEYILVDVNGYICCDPSNPLIVASLNLVIPFKFNFVDNGHGYSGNGKYYIIDIDSVLKYFREVVRIPSTSEEDEAFNSMSSENEWKNGEACRFGKDKKSGVYTAWEECNKGHIVYCCDEHFYVTDDEFFNSETESERKERERLEAAYDLYCTCGISHEKASFNEFKCEYSDVWLAIVDKTGYRKGEDNE